MQYIRSKKQGFDTRIHTTSMKKTDLEGWLPIGEDFDTDNWNIGDWTTRADRKATFNLDFTRISHPELRQVIKLGILHERSTKRISPSTCYSILVAAKNLSDIIGDMRIRDITSATLLDVSNSTRVRKGLGSIANHLRLHYGMPIFYLSPKTAVAKHGSRGTDKGRATKLISDDLILNILALNQIPDLLTIDRLMVLAIAINVSCGWRVSELLSLRADALFEDEGALYISGHTLKGGHPVRKLIPSALAPMVQQAFQSIVTITQNGRDIARDWGSSENPDWRDVVKNEQALLYFAQKLLHKWTADPLNRILNPDAAWHRERGWIDIVGTRSSFRTAEEHRKHLKLTPVTYYSMKKQQENAISGISWRPKPGNGNKEWLRDRRVCDKFTLFKQMGYATGQSYHSDRIQDLVDSALEHQLRGQAIPEPEESIEIEVRFGRTRPVHSRDSDGAPKLFVDEALFVVERNHLANFDTVNSEFQVVTVAHMSQWLAGLPSRPSVFERHGIVDAKTGEIASFKSHDIRHWLETQLHKGGLSDSQIESITGRKNDRSTSVYNQMSNRDKREFVKEGIHKGIVEGVLVDICNTSSYTKEEADRILDSRLRHINVLPFGLCLQDLAMQPCPHHLACFSATCGSVKGPCEHLVIDKSDDNQRIGLQEEKLRAIAMIDFLQEDEELCSSPQLDHFRTVLASVSGFLGEDSDEQ